MMKAFLYLSLLGLLCTPTFAAPLRTDDGLGCNVLGSALQSVSLDGKSLPGVTVETALLDPRDGKPLGSGFTVTGAWSAAPGRLVLQGEVRASGAEDTIADLVIRVHGVKIPVSTMADDPLLLPGKLLSKLPVVSLRVGGRDAGPTREGTGPAGDDCLALAVPPDKLAIFDFREAGDAVELRYRFGFTQAARPELQMRAPFTCVLYRTDPQWHFRSALQRYYALFPEQFRPFEKRQGGWFFAAETPDLPNPQHFFYHEGGPGGWEQDHDRGMGAFPYRESSSYTISLPGNKNPKTYAEAMARFEELEKQVTPKGWLPQQAFTLDTEVKHSGARSLLPDPGGTKARVGGSQTVALNPPFGKPISVSAFSRAEGVDGAPGADYSVYVDVVYADGTYLFGQTATFATGTHDWEEGKCAIEPTKPVAELRVYCLLRNHTGKAWFDDLRIGPAGQPGVNWVKNPGFEEDEKRRDLQYIRDNAAMNGRGEYVFFITDNLSADVGPDVPMNLLRFTLNPDPDIPSTQDKPSVAAGEFAYYDGVFRDMPKVDGAYIDSVSAWIYGVLNCRRDQWPANSQPFTYEPGSFKVAAAGRFAMYKYLQALQKRYHSLGKSIFTNIHVNLEAFPLYLVSDVPGIESSEFQSEDSLFFYRACSYHKPLVLLNFMNLNGLDQRSIAEKYHLNAAQWGEFPSTGRFVQEAYKEYGDVTHAYVRAINELSEAGWQPVPLASGARVERFGGKGAVYFTVRAPQAAVEQTLTIQPEALIGLGRDLAAFDAVNLTPMPMQWKGAAWTIPFTHSNGELHIVRICAREAVIPWLIERARTHAVDAGRVRGKDSQTPEIAALIQSLASPADAKAALAKLPDWRQKLEAALASVKGADDDLFALSSRREIVQARQALGAVAELVAGAKLGIDGPRSGYAGEKLTLVAESTPQGGAQVRPLSVSRTDGVQMLPPLRETETTNGATDRLTLEGLAPQTVPVRATFELTPAGQPPWIVERTASVTIKPAATMKTEEGASDAEARRYIVTIDRKAGDKPLTLQASAAPEAEVTPASQPVPAEASRLTVRVRRALDGLLRTLTFRACADDTEMARSEITYYDEPPLPADDAALAKLGAKATCDSSFDGYNPGTTINGQIDASGHWTEQAWASADNGSPHWLQIDLPGPRTVREVSIYWSLDGGRMYASRRYSIIGITNAGRKELACVDDGAPRSFLRHTFAPTEVRAIRIEQPANGGAQIRPGILWIREVAAA